VCVAGLEAHRERTPVLLDDIVSTGCTMVAALEQLVRSGSHAPLCMAVHGIFAADAWQALVDAGAGRVVTSNTVEHASNAVDVTAPLADGIRRMLRG
jgi:ribose-phosphate pyrophosphokinase